MKGSCRRIYRPQSGFTLIELLIVVGIIAILFSIAMPVYVEYSQRARIGGAINLGAPAKLAVSEYYSRTSQFPTNNTVAGISPPTEYTDVDVQAVSIKTTPSSGTVHIVLNARGNIQDGDSIMLVPNPLFGSVQWTCRSDTVSPSYLPSSCR